MTSMKIATFLFTALVSANAFGSVTFVCEENGYRLAGDIQGTEASYLVTKSRAEVSKGKMNLLRAEYDGSFMHAFAITLGDENKGAERIGIWIPAVQSLDQAGSYSGQADLFLKTSAGIFDPYAAPCVVEIK